MSTRTAEPCPATPDCLFRHGGEATAATWEAHPSGYDVAQLGRYRLIVYAGNSYYDPAGGTQVCDLYVPRGDRELQDGRMLVSRRDLETTDRASARESALRIDVGSIAEFEGL